MDVGRRLLVLLTLAAAGAAAAAGYALTAPKHYHATAQLLVAPVASSDSNFAGLDVLRDVTGKPRAADTAAVLVRSPQVADAVRTQLGIRKSASSLLGEIHTHVVGASDVVDVTADDTSAAVAAQLANAFIDALIAERTTTFQSELGGVISRDSTLLASHPSGSQAADLSKRLTALRGLQGQADPTLRRASSAVPPTSASAPVLWSAILIGAGIGLAVGAVALLVLTLLGKGGGVVAPQYARPMSDRAVEALVERLEQRIAARESALAVRERELQARIDELRSLEARDGVAQEQALRAKEAELEARERALLNARDDSSQAAALQGREDELAERERALAERVEAVTQRELAVARAQATAARSPVPDPAPKESLEALAERERSLEARAAELDDREQALAAREARLGEQAAAVEEQVASVQQRELAVARAAGKEAALLERERSLQEREQAAELVVARDTSSQAPAPPVVSGAFNLSTLEQLVQQRGGEFPDRIDEWQSTVFFLRDYAESDGTLPGSFDWLVQDTFGPLLGSGA